MSTSSRPQTISAIFQESPQKALEEAFKRNRIRLHAENKPGHRDFIFVWCSRKGDDGVNYGSFKYVYKDELVRRKYKISLIDYDIGIDYLDEIHNTKTHKNERLEVA